MRRLTSVIRGASAIVLLLFGLAAPAAAQDPFIGEMRWVAFTYAPDGWAECNGQLLAINVNQALFALIGTTYGGDGQTNFALPDMRGRAPIHAGMGPGLTDRFQGEVGGAETHSLTVDQLPAHDHALGTHTHTIPALPVDVRASSTVATTGDPAGNMLATTTVTGRGGTKGTNIYTAGKANVSLAPSAATAPSVTGAAAGMTSSAGGGQPHSIMQPFLTVKCIIALQGIFPSHP